MITRIHKYSKSVRDILTYNERKCIEGVAKAIGVLNIKSTSFYSINSTFAAFESHPGISLKAKKLGMQISINPGPDDQMTDDQAIHYAHDLLDGLGYGSQPVVIYRHDDIERRHYHCVSTRVKHNGRIIRDSYSWLKISRLQDMLAKKYGFTVGLENINCPKLRPQRLKKGSKNVIRQMMTNVWHAMSFDFRGELQFKAILRQFGIVLKRGTITAKDGTTHEYVSFRGVSPDGSFINRPVQAKKLLGMSYDDYYRQYHRETQWRDNDRVRDAIIRIKIQYERSRSFPEFEAGLKKMQIGIVCYTAGGVAADKPEESADIVFVDMNDRVCLSCRDCGLTVAQIVGLNLKKLKENKKAFTEKKGPFLQRR